MSAMASSARRYRMKCLGPVVLESPAGARLGLRTRKQLGLLFHLARRARPVARDELIELFWGEDEGRLARHSLSQCTSLINKALGAEVIVPAGRDRLALAESAVATDVAEFERLVAEGRHEDALALWRGPLFEGIWVQRAPEFERWLAEERARVQRVFRRLVHARIDALRDQGDHQEIRDEAERLLELDPLDETAMLAYLESLTILGDRSLALRRFAEFESRLKKELEAEPGSALKAWAKRQRKGDAPPARDATPIPRISEITVLPAAQPFYGRTEEFSMLWKAWEQAGTGRGSFIIIEGEAGIGKTALATKLANQAHVAGGSVCFVKCYRTDKPVPLSPISSLVRQLSRLPGFLALDSVWIGELTRLAPELRERFPQLPQPMASDEVARHRLADATASAAICVADEQPLMIVVDDLQDADEASLSLLHYVARQTLTQPILVVGARRYTADLTELERAFFDSQPALGRAVALGKLDASNVLKVIVQAAARRGIAVDNSALEPLIRLASGNPLRAIEAASRLGNSLTHGDSAEDHFENSATQRVANLPQSAFAVAAAISLAGYPLSQYELHRVTELSISELAGALARLEAEHLIQRVGPGIGFIHERYSGIIESLLNDQVRRSTHSRLALLYRRSADKSPARRYDAARHYAAAGMRGEARRQASKAAQYARSLGAIRERAQALELAMTASEEIDPSVAADLGESYYDLRDFDSLRALCDQVFDAPKSFNRGDFSFLRIAVAFHVGAASLPDLIQELQELLSNQPGFRLEARARTLLMRMTYKSGKSGAFRAAVKSLRHSLRDKGLDTRAHSLLATAYLAAKMYQPKRALPILRQALEVARANHDLDLEHHIRTGIGAVSRQLCRFADSVKELEIALTLAQRTLNPQQQACDLMDIAVSEMSLGNLDRAQKLFSNSRDIFQSHPDKGAQILLSANQAELHLHRDEVGQAKALFETALEQSWQVRELPRHLQVLGGLGLCSQRLGQLADLRRCADEIVRLGGRDPQVCHERWLIEATIAWDLAINSNNPNDAVARLMSASASLRLRDLDHSLLMDAEQHRIRARFGLQDYELIAKAEAEARSQGAGLVANVLTAFRLAK